MAVKAIIYKEALLMKRIFCMVFSLILCFVTVTTCLADNYVEPENEPSFYVARPHIKLRSPDSDDFTQLTFGNRVTIEQTYSDGHSLVTTDDGITGLVTTGFIVQTQYPLIIIDSVGCFLSYKTGLDANDFGYGACGQRWEEIAIILFEKDGYFFIITEEGFSGFVKNDDTHFSILE